MSFFLFTLGALYVQINSMSFLFSAVAALYGYIIRVSPAPSLYLFIFILSIVFSDEILAPGPPAWGFLFAGFGEQSLLVPHFGERSPQFLGDLNFGETGPDLDRHQSVAGHFVRLVGCHFGT